MKRAWWIPLALALLHHTSASATTLTLAFAGDIMLDDGPGRYAAAGGDTLAAVAPILARADYRIANLETSVAGNGTGEANANKIYTFRASPDTLKALQGRFNAVALANNHSGDYGHEAFLETIMHLDKLGIRHVGGGKNLQAAHAPLWVEQNGLRIAILAYNEYKPRSFEAGANWPGIAWSEDSEVVADIRAARRAGADLVIPFMHWGWEREQHSSPRQRQLAHAMIDAGASMVIGGHPHVTQETELYHGKPIVYSLGNFVFDGFDKPAEKTGWILVFTVDQKGVESWRTIEVQMDQDGIPHPSTSAQTPCGQRSTHRIAWCAATQ